MMMGLMMISGNPFFFFILPQSVWELSQDKPPLLESIWSFNDNWNCPENHVFIYLPSSIIWSFVGTGGRIFPSRTKTRITVCIDPIESRALGSCRVHGFCRMTNHQDYEVQKDDLRGPPRLDVPPWPLELDSQQKIFLYTNRRIIM